MHAHKFKNSKQEYCLHFKYFLLKKKPFATKHSHPSNVNYMEFFRNNLIEYTSSLSGIEKKLQELKYDAEFKKLKVHSKMCAKHRYEYP